MASIFVALMIALPALASAQPANGSRAYDYPPSQCPSCAEWNAPQNPVRIFGNTWYVGTHGLSAILIHSPQGSILIDGGLPASAASIIANIRAAGFIVEDVRLILNSHAHYDHAGGIAELQRASGAEVAVSPASVEVLRTGKVGRNDPQFEIAFPYEPVLRVRAIADGETLRVGSLAVTAHFTPGHTPGGTTWTWRSCEGSVCRDMVYADSQTPVSAEGFLFSSNSTYPNVMSDFHKGFAVLEKLPCDILLTPHPGVSNLWNRLVTPAKDSALLVDRGACKRYAATARAALARRVTTENTAR